MSVQPQIIRTRLRAERFKELQGVYSSGNCEGWFETNDFKFIVGRVYQANHPGLEISEEFVMEAEGILRESEELGFIGFRGPDIETKRQNRDKYIGFFKRCEDFERGLNQIFLDYQKRQSEQ